jgi:UDP-glucose 4-epimerase
MARLFITGIAGMLGSHLLDALAPMDHEIVGIDNLAIGSIENVKHHVARPNVVFYQMDVLDYEAMKRAAGHPDLVIHLAALKKIGEDGRGIDTLRVNTLGTENCLRIAFECGAKLVFASTSDVYGMSPDLPYREDGDLLLGPSMVKRWSYAVGKLYSEQLCFAYYKDYGVPIVVLRYFGGFSWRSSFSWSGGHIPIFIDQILRDQPVTIHGDGLQTRSMAAVTDLVEGTLLAIASDRAIGEIINIGNDEEMTVLDSAKLIHRLADTGKELKIQLIPMSEIFGKYKDVPRRRPDLSKAHQLLGYRPRTPVEEFIRLTIEERRREHASRSHQPTAAPEEFARLTSEARRRA